MIEELQVVRHNSRIGVIVPDVMNLHPQGCVMVDFDNAGLKLCVIKDLEIVGPVRVEFDMQKCGRCVFVSSSGCHPGCHRYNNGMMGLPPLSDSRKHVPKRIYPYCQDEKGEYTGFGKISTNCPKCGSKNTEEIDDSDRFLGVVGDHMLCKSCGHTWQFNAY